MKNIRRNLNGAAFFFITVLIVGLTFFFLEQSIITEKTPGYYFDPISLPNQLMLATVIISLVSIFANYIIRRIRLSLNGILIISFLASVVVVGIVNIATIPETRHLMVSFLDGSTHELILTLPMNVRLTGILTLAVNIAFIFFIILVLPNHPEFFKIISFFIIGIVGVAVFAIVYSVFKETDNYIDIIVNGYSRFTIVPSSFFNNRNPYASFLLSSQLLIVFMFFLRMNKKRRYFYFFAQFLFSIAIFFTFSKTNILLSLFLFGLTYLVRLIVQLIKKRWLWFVIEFILVGGLIAFAIVYRFLPALSTTEISLFLQKILPDSLVYVASSTMQARIHLWIYAWTLIIASPVTLILGDGPHISRYFYHQRMDFEINGTINAGMGDYHNGVMEVMHTFGLLGLAIYALVIIFAIIVIIRRRKTNPALAAFLLISLTIFLLRSQTESLAMLMFKSEGIMASFAFVLPFLYYVRLSHKKGYGKKIKLKS